MLNEALKLPTEARAALADLLLDSLDVEVDEMLSRLGDKRFSNVFTKLTAEPLN